MTTTKRDESWEKYWNDYLNGVGSVEAPLKSTFFDAYRLGHADAMEEWKERVENTNTFMRSLEAKNAALEKETKEAHGLLAEFLEVGKDMKAKLSVACEALEKVIARSHSWIITEETARIESPIHQAYREIAVEYLAKLKEMECPPLNL